MSYTRSEATGITPDITDTLYRLYPPRLRAIGRRLIEGRLTTLHLDFPTDFMEVE